MASDAHLPRSARARSDFYQKYLDARDSTANTVLGQFAGRGGLLRIQRKQTLKYFESLSDPEQTQESEEVQIATVETSGRPARYPLLREDSKISNSGTSYYSAISHQSIQEEDVVEQRCHTPAPSVVAVADLSAPYTVSVPSNPQHDKAGSRSTLVIPVASTRPRRCFVDLDADCAVAATWPKPPETPKPKPPAEIVKIHPLTIYLGQEKKATRWEIRDWIDDCAYYTKEARERVRKPTEERQCPEYYLMKNFNPLNVHKPWSPREERTNKNMENILMSTGWAAEPTIHRRIQLAREEAQKAHARQEAVRKAQARTARAALIAEAAFRERQARRAQKSLEVSAMVKPEGRKPAKENKVHFAVDEADEADESSEVTPATPEASKTVLEEVNGVPEPVDSVSRNERFKIERSAPIDIPKPSKYPRRGPEFLSENMRRGMRLIAASQIK